jgi:hypothetical protein
MLVHFPSLPLLRWTSLMGLSTARPPLPPHARFLQQTHVQGFTKDPSTAPVSDRFILDLSFPHSFWAIEKENGEFLSSCE